MLGATGLIDMAWRPILLSSGWRRRTGILRADLLAVPLPCWVHPADIEGLAQLGALLDFAAGQLEVRVGRWGEWHSVTLHAQQRKRGSFRVEIEGRVLPRGEWWLPLEPFAPLP